MKTPLILACALLVVFVAVIATNDGARYQSPCIMSWDENDGDTTFCIMTQQAAHLEHRYGKVQP